jgi:hypothetical protein
LAACAQRRAVARELAFGRERSDRIRAGNRYPSAALLYRRL